MKILVVGGTGFLGGAVVEAARLSGHEVAVFTRGKTARALPPGVEVIVGDRHGDLSALSGRSFDLVVDTCAYAPDAVAGLLDALGPGIGRYALVSSISAYEAFREPGVHEDSPTSRATPEQLEHARALPPEQRSSARSYGDAYGAMKRECELAAFDRLGERVLAVRAGLLVGAGDYSDRLTYWVRRVDQGGLVACPGDPARLVQVIDVRDIARWIVDAAARGVGGAFNVTSRPFAMEALLEGCRRVAGSNARFRWIPDDRILAAGLTPWIEVPLWMPKTNKDLRYILDVAVDKAFGEGLTTRPLEETLANILDWDRSRRDVSLEAGLSRDKEAALL